MHENIILSIELSDLPDRPTPHHGQLQWHHLPEECVAEILAGSEKLKGEQFKFR